METDLADRYYRGELSSDERREFERQMEQDAELKKKVLLHKDLLEGIDYHFSQGLKSKLQQADQGSESVTKGVKHRHLWKGLGVAASVLFLFLLGYLLLDQQASPEEVYQAYYQPYPNIINPVERSAGQTEDDLSTAMRAYEQGRYQDAIALFEQQFDELSPSYRFYLALSYLETDQNQQALKLLEEVEKIGDETFYLPSLWYQALANLAAGKTEEAQMVLQKLIHAGDNTYSSKAEEIVDALK